ncbi:MAG: acyl-CoA dehydrogenase family protein [Myxococcota bacterium]
MPPTLFDSWFDDSHVAFRAVARRFAETAIAPFATDWEEAGEFPRELYVQAAEAGLLGPTYPADLGGGGGDVFHAVVLGEELLRGGSTGVVIGLGSLAIALPPVLELGTPEQKARIVPPILRGEHIAALAITEPGTGSDVSAVRTRAVRDGDSYVLNGAKTFITSGVRADLVTVLARTGDDPHGGLTFFAVDTKLPGFHVSRALKKHGWWASDTAELHFEDLRVPIESRLGPEGSGFPALMRNFEGERLMLAVNGHALAELAFDDALAWARERKAFGRPIGKFQVTRHKLADMATRIASAKALTYGVAARIRDGHPSPVEVAMAKNHASEVAREVCWEAVQILGGMGYMRETRVERFLRDARLLPIGGGTSEIMNEIIGRMGLGL